MGSRSLLGAIGLMLVLLPATAWAQDTGADVVVRPASFDRIPIAVADGQGDGQLGADAAAILRRDFEISGYFDVISPATFLPGLDREGLATSDTRFDGWFGSGAEALVKFKATTSGNAVSFDFRLYDVTKAKEIALSYENPAANAESYRQAVHAFANAVIKYYSGEEGIFGQTVLVVRKGRGQTHVYKVGVDGYGLAAVSSGNGLNLLPAWGPNGSVLYTSYDSGNPDLVMSSGGSRTVVSSAPGMNTGADYCSGSGRIALTLARDDNPEIYTVSPEGSGATRLTDNGYIDTSPTWSPDCSRIAFVSNRGGSAQIYVMNADGSGARVVTTAGKYNTSPSWSPKGDKIAFTARDEYNVFDIFTVDVDSGYMERLSQDQGNNEEPSWSSDGRYLAFTSTRDGSSKLFIMTSDGRFQTAITDGGGFETPAWGR